jgi:GxxExxY protein
MALLYKEATDQIIKIYYSVYNELGYGFLEKVYQNAMYLALSSSHLQVEAQKQVKVNFRGSVIGEYYPDLIVNNIIVLELKAVESIIPQHERQLLNYLRGTDIEVGLLFNFGPKPEFRRKVFENHIKNPR